MTCRTCLHPFRRQSNEVETSRPERTPGKGRGLRDIRVVPISVESQSVAICGLNLRRRSAQLSRMPPSSKPTRVAEVTRPLVAAVLLGQWLLLLAFSSSEKLHHSLCDQSQQPAH